MGQQKPTLIACACAALLAAAVVPGCSVIGYGVGSAIDAGTPAVTLQDSVVVGSQYIGKRLTLLTRDRQSITGICTGWVKSEDTTYMRRYDQAVAAGLTPALDEPITVVTMEAESLYGSMAGYRIAPPPARYRDLKARAATSWQLCLRLEGAGADTALMLNSVKAIVTTDAQVFTPDSLQYNLALGRITTGDGFVLVNWRRSISDSVTGQYSSVSARDSVVVPASDIARVEISNDRKTKRLLGKLGLLFDAIMVVLIAAEGDGLGGQ